MIHEPDQIDMMEDEDIRTELRRLIVENIKLAELLEKEQEAPAKARTNYWRSKYFEQLEATRDSNKGCRRLSTGKKKRREADIRWQEEQEVVAEEVKGKKTHGLVSLHQA